MTSLSSLDRRSNHDNSSFNKKKHQTQALQAEIQQLLEGFQFHNATNSRSTRGACTIVPKVNCCPLTRLDVEQVTLDGHDHIYYHAQFPSEPAMRGYTYAVKTTTKTCNNLSLEYWLHYKNLVQEARFLSTLSHPHIRQLHAISTFSSFEENSPMPFCLVLNTISETLQDRIRTTWRRQQQHIHLAYPSPTGRIFRRRAMRAKKLSIPSKDICIDRIRTIALPVAQAIAYLHAQGIALPKRTSIVPLIGFDGRGVLQLSNLESAQWMDPIVQQEQVYHDVHSFAHFLLVLVTLDESLFLVYEDDDDLSWTPLLPWIPSGRLARLIQECILPQTPSMTFKRIVKRLMEVILERTFPHCTQLNFFHPPPLKTTRSPTSSPVKNKVSIISSSRSSLWSSLLCSNIHSSSNLQPKHQSRTLTGGINRPIPATTLLLRATSTTTHMTMGESSFTSETCLSSDWEEEEELENDDRGVVAVG